MSLAFKQASPEARTKNNPRQSRNDAQIQPVALYHQAANLANMIARHPQHPTPLSGQAVNKGQDVFVMWTSY
jgi:hypothetical protein